MQTEEGAQAKILAVGAVAWRWALERSPPRDPLNGVRQWLATGLRSGMVPNYSSQRSTAIAVTSSGTYAILASRIFRARRGVCLR